MVVVEQAEEVTQSVKMYKEIQNMSESTNQASDKQRFTRIIAFISHLMIEREI